MRAQIAKWDLQSCHPDAQALQRFIQRSGLAPLIDCSYSKGNKEVISTFVERWHLETNTFHLPFSEMSITLEDVSILLNIPVVGKAVAVENFG
ncbi:hypothetical protein Syun_003377 [Stephania yunnanensis]|uniref:Aminotransferase-like plant mobile domain-containing protein n=1 Tax=Stephania yunnanensis TaxID=152371 RepID=A0AAP0Q0J8_9MAGN